MTRSQEVSSWTLLADCDNSRQITEKEKREEEKREKETEFIKKIDNYTKNMSVSQITNCTYSFCLNNFYLNFAASINLQLFISLCYFITRYTYWMRVYSYRFLNKVEKRRYNSCIPLISHNGFYYGYHIVEFLRPSILAPLSASRFSSSEPPHLRSLGRSKRRRGWWTHKVKQRKQRGNEKESGAHVAVSGSEHREE